MFSRFWVWFASNLYYMKYVINNESLLDNDVLNMKVITCLTEMKRNQ